MNKPELENCVVCGGFAHNTPGVYKPFNMNSGPCGFCKGTGLVSPEINWVLDPQPVQVRVGKRKKKLFSRIFDFVLTVIFSMIILVLVLVVVAVVCGIVLRLFGIH